VSMHLTPIERDLYNTDGPSLAAGTA